MPGPDDAFRGQQGFHAEEEPPIMTTETRGEYPPSVLVGGVLGQRLDGWVHGRGHRNEACEGGEPSRGSATDALCKYSYASAVQL